MNNARVVDIANTEIQLASLGNDAALSLALDALDSEILFED